jgi:hypothetical protein
MCALAMLFINPVGFIRIICCEAMNMFAVHTMFYNMKGLWRYCTHFSNICRYWNVLLVYGTNFIPCYWYWNYYIISLLIVLDRIMSHYR